MPCISAIYCLQICVQTLEGCRLSLNFPRIKCFVDTCACCRNLNRILVPINIVDWRWASKLQTLLHVHILNLYSESLSACESCYQLSKHFLMNDVHGHEERLNELVKQNCNIHNLYINIFCVWDLIVMLSVHRILNLIQEIAKHFNHAPYFCTEY